jgi:hypothetical protein
MANSKKFRWFLLIHQPAVAGAFDEGDARLHRVAHQRVQRVDQRALDEAVDQQPVRLGIDVGNAIVVALSPFGVIMPSSR